MTPSSDNILSRLRLLIDSITPRLPGKATDTGPVYVFHHIPKCGGSSLLKALASWFILVKEYRTEWKMNYPKITSLEKLTSRHCLCGHFESEGYYLCQRYPEVLLPGRYKVFTFVRDPLLLILSLYRYERENKLQVLSSVEEYLLARPNYIASILQVTESDYREIIDRYFFVGILEEAQASLDLLANLIGKQGLHMPVRNSTRPVPGTGVEELSSDLVAKFKEINRLDYLIYAYCLERYEISKSVKKVN